MFRWMMRRKKPRPTRRKVYSDVIVTCDVCGGTGPEHAFWKGHPVGHWSCLVREITGEPDADPRRRSGYGNRNIKKHVTAADAG